MALFIYFIISPREGDGKRWRKASRSLKAKMQLTSTFGRDPYSPCSMAYRHRRHNFVTAFKKPPQSVT